jgi:competence protein ComEA
MVYCRLAGCQERPDMSSNKDSIIAEKFLNGWTFATVLLIIIIVIGSMIIWSKYNRAGGVEISLITNENSPGQVYVSGEVNNPGLYPLREGDNIDDILKAAGGLTGSADALHIKLVVPGNGDENAPQKVDINRAGAWLLAALPGIGNTRAQAIIAYREKNGPFRDANELLNVAGIGNSIFEGIKNLVAVNE